MCTSKMICEMFNTTGVKGSWSEINLAHTLLQVKKDGLDTSMGQ